MHRSLKITAAITLIFASLFVFTREVKAESSPSKPQIALIFDDLGESLYDLRRIHGLDIPLTVAVIPGLEFSENIARISARVGFSVIVHLPLEPKRGDMYQTSKYKFISSALTDSEVSSLTRSYLDSVPHATGANNHMGSAATEDYKLMRKVMGEVKTKGFIFVDSHTSPRSVACKAALAEGVSCEANDGFLDARDSREWVEQKLRGLAKLAKIKKKIIVIGHPKKATLDVLERILPELRRELEFITIDQYFQDTN